MKRRIDDPARPNGYYYGYESASDCLADYEAEMGRRKTSEVEAIAGYACFWVFLAMVVVLTIVAGAFQW